MTKLKYKHNRLIYGVGINDVDETTLLGYTSDGKQIRCPYYTRWRTLLQRCYSEKFWNRQDKKGYYPNAKYRYCTLAEEWHTFSNFKSWMEKQDWKGNQLDKDILVPGNMTYGPDTCLFVPPHINTMLVDQKESPLGKGVWRERKSPKDKPRYRYQLRHIATGKRLSVGPFATPAEASAAYCKAKYELLVAEANKLKDIRVRDALINYAKIKYTEN